MRTISLTLTGAAQTDFTLSDTATAEETRAAIQQALDAASAHTGGGQVRLSEGVFVVAPHGDAGDGAIRVGSNTVFEGAGLGVTTIKLMDNPGHDVTGVVRTDSGKTAADGTPIATHDVTIRGLSIDANKANANGSLVDGFFSGPKPFTAVAVDKNIALENVEVCNASRYGFDPHEQTDGLSFSKCVAHDNTQDGFTIDYCSNVTFTGCEAYGNGRHGFNIVTSSHDVTMSGTLAHDNAVSGIVVQTGNFETRILTAGVTILGGCVTNNGSDGIVVRQAYDVAIGGASGSDGVTITGNGRFGVLVEGGVGIAIENNTISGNTGGTGTDCADIRVRGYLQTYLDSDPLNDVFVQSANITISGNTIGAQAGIHDYALSYSDTDALVFSDTNTVVSVLGGTIEDTSKQAGANLFTDVITTGDDIIYGSDGSDSIAANTGNDTMDGGGGDDTLYGGDGDDTLDGGAGIDTLVGGFGNDIYLADGSETIVESALSGDDEVQTLLASYALDANIERLVYTGAGAFAGAGNELDNFMSSGAGDDILDGGAGADRLEGGDGNDVYVLDDANDVVSDTAGIDTIKTTLSTALDDAIENLVLLGTGGLYGIGNASDNALTGNSGANSLYGGDGNDVLDGGAGGDFLDGGNGDDVYFVDGTDDFITDSGGRDVVKSLVSFALDFGIEELRLLGTADLAGTGNAEANVLSGNAGNNTLEGKDGDDTLIGGAGTDTLAGGNGNDRYWVDQTADVIVETAGIDRVFASATYRLATGVEQLSLTGTAAIDGTGNVLDNVMAGNAANNRLFGLAGRDTLIGGDGNDILAGGAGRDVLTGGAGLDRFVFNAALSNATNIDRIRDFSSADDTIVLSKAIFGAIGHTGTLTDAEIAFGTKAADADDRIVYNAATGALVYDSNGSAAGGATYFAFVAAGTALAAADFTIV